MSKSETVTKKMCPKCEGTEFEMTAEVRSEVKYGITIENNTIVGVDFNKIEYVEHDKILEGTESVFCSKCGHEVPIEDLKNDIY